MLDLSREYTYIYIYVYISLSLSLCEREWKIKWEYRVAMKGLFLCSTPAAPESCGNTTHLSSSEASLERDKYVSYSLNALKGVI